MKHRKHLFVELFSVSGKGITHVEKKNKLLYTLCQKMREIIRFHINSVTAICSITLWLLHMYFVLDSHFTLPVLEKHFPCIPHYL